MSNERPIDPRFTDVTNGKRFVNQHGDLVRYVAEDKAWVAWDETRWKPDTLGESMELAKETAISIYDEAKAGESFGAPCSNKEASEWATTSLGAGKLAAMLKMSSTDRRVAISAEVLDRDVYLLNCVNGTVDLRTGALRPAEQADLITKSTGVAFDADATCPRFDDFLSWAMLNRPELVAYVWRIMGMSLSGDVSERLVLFLHGTGKNGKDVTLKVMQGIFGDYAQRMESKTLEAASYAKGGGGPSDDIASLKGARLVYTSEIEDGTKLATALLKDMTGDQKLRARHLYKSSFMFMPEFTPFIAANHKPTVPADDQAVWDRLRLVPYDARVTEEMRNKHLAEQLIAAEAPGILARAVSECLAWQRDGIVTPAVVMEATADYRDEMNTFADFLTSITDNTCAVDTSPSALREHYNRWSKNGGTLDGDPMTQREFIRHMKASGWKQSKVEGQRRWIAAKTETQRTNYGELVRLAERHVPTPEETAAYEAEVRAIFDEEEAEARACGFESADAMREAEAQRREDDHDVA